MKKILFVLVSIAILVSCTGDSEDPETTGEVVFSFTQKERPSGGGGDAEDLSFVLVRLQNEDGIAPLDVKLPVVASDNRYISIPIGLPVGQYRITQFAALDADDKIVMATPAEDSELAELVSDPLPSGFRVEGNITNMVEQEVVEVTEDDEPEDFGFVSFNLKGKGGMTIFQLPDIGTEVIRKVTYRISDHAMTIEGERNGYPPLLDLEDATLIGKTLASRIVLWVESGDCVQKVYVFRGEITFTGALIRLPAFESWGAYYYSPEEHGIGIYRSADPSQSLHVEIEYPSNDYKLFFASMDFYCWNDHEEYSSYLFFDTYRASRITSTDFGQLGCEMNEELEFDTYMVIYSSWDPPVAYAASYFAWEVNNGVVQPKNCGAGLVPNEAFRQKRLRAHREKMLIGKKR